MEGLFSDFYATQCTCTCANSTVPLFPDRSFPRHKMFIQGTSEGKEGRAALFRVLAVYALYNPEVSYCQGSNPTHAPIVLFVCLFVLTSPVMLNGLFDLLLRFTVRMIFHYFDSKKIKRCALSKRLQQHVL